MGACATFLYNLRQGIGDIQSGAARVVIVGGAEAPIEPEVIEGFKAMGALAEDQQIAELDGTETADNRRASRPFAENAGFTISEASQFFRDFGFEHENLDHIVCHLPVFYKCRLE